MFRLPNFHASFGTGTGLGALVLAAALWLLPSPSLAGGDITGLDVLTNPTLAVTAEYKGQRVFAVSSGQIVQLEVQASFSDGSSLDVTDLPTTTYTSLTPNLVTVDESGVLTFAQTSARGAVAVSIDHAGAALLVSFDLNP